jgi:hypothetical protein
MASIRRFVCALLLLAPALAWAQSGIALRADANDPQAVQARLDTPTRLQVFVESGDAPLGGREVRWQLEPADGAILSRDKGLSSTGGDGQPPVGSASTLFTAHRAGSYVVSASTLVDAACTGDACAWSKVEFRIEVPRAAAAKSGGLGATATAALIGAGALGVYALSQEDESNPGVRGLALVSGNSQTVNANNPAPNPLVVRASHDGAPDAGVTIEWSVSGGATLSASSTTTDSSGNAQVTVTNVGPGPGPFLEPPLKDGERHRAVLQNLVEFLEIELRT